MPTIVSVYSKHAVCVLHLLNRTGCYVWLYPKNLRLFVFEMHLISGITDEWQGCEPPPPLAKLNVNTGPVPSLCFGIYYSFGFSRLLLFSCFSGFIPMISCICIAVQYRICYCFSTIFWILEHKTGIDFYSFINTKKAFKKLCMFYFETFRITLIPSLVIK